MIRGMIEQSRLSDRAKRWAIGIFTKIAAAEAEVHGCDIERVHFHEVGAIDSIADIVGCAVGFDYLDIEGFLSSPVPTGCGTIRIAHGVCSVPAPATLLLLRGVPIAASAIPMELTTPTGAGILSTLVSEFGPLPGMIVESVGCGAGTREIEDQANMLRIVLGHLTRETTAEEKTWVVETNLDTASGELLGYVQERLWALESKPLDVWTTAIGMKKGRPGILLSILCRSESVDAVEDLLLMETTTLGVRRSAVERTTLKREAVTVETPWGPLAAKRATLPDGSRRTSIEYEAARELAARLQLPLQDVYNAVKTEQ